MTCCCETTQEKYKDHLEGEEGEVKEKSESILGKKEEIMANPAKEKEEEKYNKKAKGEEEERKNEEAPNEESINDVVVTNFSN